MDWIGWLKGLWSAPPAGSTRSVYLRTHNLTFPSSSSSVDPLARGCNFPALIPSLPSVRCYAASHPQLAVLLPFRRFRQTPVLSCRPVLDSRCVKPIELLGVTYPKVGTGRTSGKRVATPSKVAIRYRCVYIRLISCPAAKGKRGRGKLRIQRCVVRASRKR